MIKNIFKKISPILLGLVVALGITSLASQAVTYGQEAELNDCATLNIPDNTEVNTYLDKENGVLSVFWFDESIGADVHKSFKYQDKACKTNKKVAHTIEHVLETDAIQQKGICESMKQDIQNNVTEKHEQKRNLEAAKRYVKKWCH